MTTDADIVNRACQVIGTRTTVTLAELANGTSNEAIQAELILEPFRRQLLRMAPWNPGLKTANLIYITSSPGTPENVSAATTLWQPGQPPPPWAYEYQYPADCLRACWIIPATQTGFAGGVPITTAVTGGAPSFWQGPPVKFKVQNDTFVPVNSAAVAFGGINAEVGDLITLQAGLNTNPPIGAPVVLEVTAETAGVITAVSVVSQINNSVPPKGGSYFAKQTNPVPQGTTTGIGTGATFNLTYGAGSPQRVILTNQEFATLSYVSDISDWDVMDDLFIEAYVRVLGSGLCMPLSGDKKLAQLAVQEANAMIERARTPDGNEGFTVNDVTPDWIRIRGIDFAQPYSGPFGGFDWGSLWPTFG